MADIPNTIANSTEKPPSADMLHEEAELQSMISKERTVSEAPIQN